MIYGINGSQMNNPYAAYGTMGAMGISPSADGNKVGSEADSIGLGTGTGKGDNLKVNGTECQTCKNRKYQDGSDEMVSFKSAAHMSPTEAGTRVRAHEQEHVSNAYDQAFEKGGKVLSASVSLKTAICPECGRSYIAGGQTTTRIKYSDESNPYQKNMKSAHQATLKGMNFDAGV